MRFVLQKIFHEFWIIHYKLKRKIMKKLVFFVALFFTGIVSAQSYDWGGSSSGTNEQVVTSVATDDDGNVYSTGYFQGTVDFDPSIGGVSNMASGPRIAGFIQKLNAAGDLQWRRRFRTTNGLGAGDVKSNSIAVANTGNVYITGSFTGSASFNLGAAVPSNGNTDIFVVCVNPTNGFTLFKNTYGGTGFDEGNAIAAEHSVYVAGSFENIINFGGGTGNKTAPPGSSDAFVLGVNSLIALTPNWVAVNSSAGDVKAEGIDIGEGEKIFVTGHFIDPTDFNKGGVTTLLLTGGPLFIQKFDWTGDQDWVKSVDAEFAHSSSCIAADDEGNSYLTGYYEETKTFGGGPAGTVTAVGNKDIFVLKHDHYGDFKWVKSFGDGEEDFGNSIRLDKCGGVYVTGGFSKTVGFKPGSLVSYITSQYDVDGFSLKLKDDGSFVWVNSLKSSGRLSGQANAVDLAGNAIIVGQFVEPMTYGGLPLVIASLSDMYFVKQKSNNSSPIITSQPTNQFAHKNCTATFTCLVSTPGVSYQWEVYNTVTTEWEKVYDTADFSAYSGAYSSTLSIVVPTTWGLSTKDYRCVINGNNCSSNMISDVAVLTVGNLVCIGDPDDDDDHAGFALSDAGYTVYPNPFSSVLNINVSSEKEETLTITILDISGKIVFTSADYKTNRNIQISENLENGIYTIQLQHGEHTELKRIIKN